MCALPSEPLHDWMKGTFEQATEIALAAHGPDLEWHRVEKAVGNVRSGWPLLVVPLAP